MIMHSITGFDPLDDSHSLMGYSAWILGWDTWLGSWDQLGHLDRISVISNSIIPCPRRDKRLRTIVLSKKIALFWGPRHHFQTPERYFLFTSPSGRHRRK